MNISIDTNKVLQGDRDKARSIISTGWKCNAITRSKHNNIRRETRGGNITNAIARPKNKSGNQAPKEATNRTTCIEFWIYGQQLHGMTLLHKAVEANKWGRRKGAKENRGVGRLRKSSEDDLASGVIMPA
jgi:hypothetical protein